MAAPKSPCPRRAKARAAWLTRWPTYVQQLMGVMAMPGLTPEQQAVVRLRLQTRMGQLTAPNPDADEDRARERRARDAEMLEAMAGTPVEPVCRDGEMPRVGFTNSARPR